MAIFHRKAHQLDTSKNSAIMGILNLTPDSFFDGSRSPSLDAALRRALQMEADGADILDIGGESTRPGFTPISAQQELARVLPLIERLSAECPLPLSIDTTKAEVALEAAKAGASIINDVSGLQDPMMAQTVAQTGCGLVLCYRGAPLADASSIVKRSLSFFEQALAHCDAAAIPRSHICLDPNIGFYKDYAENIAVLRNLPAFSAFSLPLLVGLSRKSFIGITLDGIAAKDRLSGSLAALVCAIAGGARLLRVHDVKESKEAARMADLLLQ